VLGAVLLGIIVLFVSCSGGDDKKGQHPNAGSSSAKSKTPSSAPDTDPSFINDPGNGPALPDPSSIESQPPATAGGGDGATATLPPSAGVGANTNVTAPADGTCADTEIVLIPTPAVTTVKRGAPVDLSITIKNVGTRSCSRDVGSDPQELYLSIGARKYWSSDDCSTSNGNDVRAFGPGASRTYKITWNGRQSSSCASGQPAGPNPPPGQFQLRARLGTRVSDPVAITIVS
jgi:hypothetical protein